MRDRLIKKTKEKLDEIIIKNVKLAEKQNEDEIMGRIVNLTMKIEKEEKSEDMLELSILVMMIEIADEINKEELKK